MSDRFAVNTHITDDSGEMHRFLIGEVVPEWALPKCKPHVLVQVAEKAADPDEPVDYESMSVKQLVAIATERNIDLQTNKKSEILDAIYAHDASQRDMAEQIEFENEDQTQE